MHLACLSSSLLHQLSTTLWVSLAILLPTTSLLSCCSLCSSFTASLLSSSPTHLLHSHELPIHSPYPISCTTTLIFRSLYLEGTSWYKFTATLFSSPPSLSLSFQNLQMRIIIYLLYSKTPVSVPLS